MTLAAAGDIVEGFIAGNTEIIGSTLGATSSTGRVVLTSFNDCRVGFRFGAAGFSFFNGGGFDVGSRRHHQQRRIIALETATGINHPDRTAHGESRCSPTPDPTATGDVTSNSPDNAVGTLAGAASSAVSGSPTATPRTYDWNRELLSFRRGPTSRIRRRAPACPRSSAGCPARSSRSRTSATSSLIPPLRLESEWTDRSRCDRKFHQQRSVRMLLLIHGRSIRPPRPATSSTASIAAIPRSGIRPSAER